MRVIHHDFLLLADGFEEFDEEVVVVNGLLRIDTHISFQVLCGTLLSGILLVASGFIARLIGFQGRLATWLGRICSLF